MPSKTSSLNKEIILQIIRSVGWISIVYFFGLLFALPLRMMMKYTNVRVNEIPPPVNSLFEFDFVIQLSLLLTIPILLAVFLFRFLQVKQAADLMHSLPIRREKMFHHYALSGIISLILPVALIVLVVLIMHTTLDLNIYFETKDIWYWAGTTILFNLLFFTAGTFVAMMTGISAVQGVLTYIFLLFPAGITLLMNANLKILLFGFPGDYYVTRNLEKMSPLTYAATLDGRPLQWVEIVLYAVMVILLYGLALYFYKKRKIESASEAIVFPKLRSLFQYGAAFCAMLLGGMYFNEVQFNSLGWTVFGYVIGASIGYFVAEMVLQKTWRVFGKVKGLAIYGIVVAVLFTAIQTLGVYENHVPKLDEVKNVLLTDSTHIYLDQELYGHVFTPSTLKEKDNIQAVRELHQQIIADKRIDQLDGNNYEIAFFLYELNNGDQVIRQYRINKKLYEDFYKPIYQTEEYKLATNEIFHLDVDKINNLTISSHDYANKSVTINETDELIEILEVLKVDVLEESYADGVYFNGRGSSIEIFSGKEEYVHMTFKPIYKKLNQWLEERNLLEKAKVMPEDISSMKIAEWNGVETYHPDEVIAEFEGRSDVLEITDKAQINEVLNSSGWGQNNKYIIVLHYEKGNYPEILYLDEEHAPDFIK